MDLYAKGVRTAVGTADKLVEGQACLVYWIAISPATLATIGLLKIRDGFDSSGKEVFRISTGQGLHVAFIPPLRCASGVFIDVDAAIGSFTVGYLTEEMLGEE